MRVVDLIIKKKLGQELTKEEIHFLIDGYVKDEIPDYQISALLMAIAINGLTEQEQFFLTFEMLNSGDQIDLSSVEGIKADKHSTGGVGDKTTLVVAPLVASCGVKMAKMSGRGLGHTGGTLDKLEAIPNFRIALTDKEFLNQVRDISIAVVGQTGEIAPADKKLYALRDVTGTVESIGLIASSIMSKKLASGASHILLDVKVGDGAFMKDLNEARKLADAMVKIGNFAGKKVVAMLTDMDQPLGIAVGNSIEVIEAIETLKGNGPEDFNTLCIELASELLLMTEVSNTKEEAVKLVKEKINNGEALDKLRQMIRYQSGDERVIDDYSLFPSAKSIITIQSDVEGYVEKINTLEIGRAAMLLGAGRSNKDDEIDLAVGVKVFKKVGDKVNLGDVIAEIHANEKNIDVAIETIKAAYKISSQEVRKNQIILDIVS
ncbi:MAG TPA: pyrimidine-nucleoside phosphorylase [Acholeplasmataceae bacterium]|nr:pyrimidine-nucleoside phosphorylase [Acholeplasmataceae bacterium]